MNDSSSREAQRFPDLKDPDLAEWRGQPPSRLLLSYLQDLRQASLVQTSDCLRGKDDRAAMIAIGHRELAEHLWNVIHPQQALPENPEPEFKDPASIRRRGAKAK